MASPTPLIDAISASFAGKARNIAIIDHGTIVENTSMKRLLASLDVETFVLDINHVPVELPPIPGITLRRLDEHTLEAEMSRSHDLNSLFAALSSQGMTVTSMRNKTNRLEELFVRLVENGRTTKENVEKIA